MSEERNDDIGTLLKVRRQELGLSLQDAAQRTRIRKSYLESLEASQFSDLPGNVYVKGFVRVYSNYLGLDSAPLLAMLEVPTDERLEPTRASAPALRTHISTSKRRKTRGNGAFFAIAFVIVVVVGGALYFLLSDSQKSAVVMTEQDPPRIETKSQKSQQKEEVEQVVEESPPAEEIAQAPATPEKEEPAPAEVVAKPASKLLLPVIKAEGSSLRMLALSPGSLIIHVDNRKPHEYSLHEGLDLTWKVREKLSFELGGAKQARFWLDDSEIELGDHLSIQLIQIP